MGLYINVGSFNPNVISPPGPTASDFYNTMKTLVTELQTEYRKILYTDVFVSSGATSDTFTMQSVDRDANVSVVFANQISPGAAGAAIPPAFSSDFPDAVEVSTSVGVLGNTAGGGLAKVGFSVVGGLDYVTFKSMTQALGTQYRKIFYFNPNSGDTFYSFLIVAYDEESSMFLFFKNNVVGQASFPVSSDFPDAIRLPAPVSGVSGN